MIKKTHTFVIFNIQLYLFYARKIMQFSKNKSICYPLAWWHITIWIKFIWNSKQMFTFSVIRVCLCLPWIISRTGPCFNSSVVLTNHIQRRETSFWLKSIFLVFTVWEPKSAWNAVGWFTLMVVVPAWNILSLFLYQNVMASTLQTFM